METRLENLGNELVADIPIQVWTVVGQMDREGQLVLLPGGRTLRWLGRGESKMTLGKTGQTMA